MFVKVDKDILDFYLDLFLQRVQSHQNGLKQYLRMGDLREKFEQVNTSNLCGEDLIQRIKPVPGYSSVDILTGANEIFRNIKQEFLDFGPDEKVKRRCIEASASVYKHEQAIGYLGRIDNARISIKALHDLVDAQTMYYAALRRRHMGGATIGGIEKYAQKLHEMVSAIEKIDPPRPSENNVVQFRLKKS